MSTQLQDFLEQHRAEFNAGQVTIDEWRAAIHQLFSQLRDWLKTSDPKGLIEISERLEDIDEPGLGRYRVPRLDLRVLGKWIGIIPKARRTVGTAHPALRSVPKRADGRVDITDELKRYVLYRFRIDDGDEWYIDHAPPEREWPGQVLYVPKSEPKKLDRETFEKALMSYLQ